jgi:hypothetical protein
MTADIPGSCLTKRAGPEPVPSVRAETFEERKKAEEMMESLGEDRGDVAEDLNRNSPQGKPFP